MLIVDDSGLGKTNALLNLISHQPDIDKVHLHTKDPYEAKQQFSINKPEKVHLRNFDDPKAFIKYSNNLDNIYENNAAWNPNKKRKIWIYLII